jgi:transcriptional regulator with PAS, ATPase and Fis domain
MKSFIAKSKASKEILKIATLSSTLPVNCIILGDKAVGKNYLAKIVAPNAKSYQALDLQKALKSKTLDLNTINEIIILDIHKIGSVNQIMELFEEKHIKVVATATEQKESYKDFFQAQIEVPPLSQRKEDVEFLKQEYIKEAKRTFLIDDDINENIELDLSNNAISLKKSIFRSILFDSLTKNDIINILEKFLLKEFEEQSTYKELLSIFEIPLLRAGKKKYKSQLQMAKHFDINRNTLRKKMIENNIDE